MSDCSISQLRSAALIAHNTVSVTVCYLWKVFTSKNPITLQSSPPQDEKLFTSACYMSTDHRLLYSSSDSSLTLSGQDTETSFTVSFSAWVLCALQVGWCCVFSVLSCGQGHTAPVTCLCWNKKDTLLASGSENGRILLHEVSSPRLPVVLYQGQGQEVSHLCYPWFWSPLSPPLPPSLPVVEDFLSSLLPIWVELGCLL